MSFSYYPDSQSLENRKIDFIHSDAYCYFYQINNERIIITTSNNPNGYTAVSDIPLGLFGTGITVHESMRDYYEKSILNYSVYYAKKATQRICPKYIGISIGTSTTSALLYAILDFHLNELMHSDRIATSGFSEVIIDKRIVGDHFFLILNNKSNYVVKTLNLNTDSDLPIYIMKFILNDPALNGVVYSGIAVDLNPDKAVYKAMLNAMSLKSRVERSLIFSALNKFNSNHIIHYPNGNVSNSFFRNKTIDDSVVSNVYSKVSLTDLPNFDDGHFGGLKKLLSALKTRGRIVKYSDKTPFVIKKKGWHVISIYLKNDE